MNSQEPIINSEEGLKEILTEDQMDFLYRWIDLEELDPKSVQCQDEYLNGIRVWALDPKTNEKWEIDFTRRRNNEF